MTGWGDISIVSNSFFIEWWFFAEWSD